MAPAPKLSVIRGGKREDRAPQREIHHAPPRSGAVHGKQGHSADQDTGVISLMEGWVRVLERQANAIRP